MTGFLFTTTAGWLLLVFGFLFAVFAVWYAVTTIRWMRRWRNTPTETARVSLVKKSTENDRSKRDFVYRFACFRTDAGREITLGIADAQVFAAMQTGSSGTLTYQATKFLSYVPDAHGEGGSGYGTGQSNI